MGVGLRMQRGHMTTYCLKCPEPTCTYTGTTPEHGLIGLLNCPFHGDAALLRDYKAEAVGIGSGVRESRSELSSSGYRDLFLPSEADLSSKDDPTGEKGMKEWMAEHEPKEGNKHPILPERTKHSFHMS